MNVISVVKNYDQTRRFFAHGRSGTQESEREEGQKESAEGEKGKMLIRIICNEEEGKRWPEIQEIFDKTMKHLVKANFKGIMQIESDKFTETSKEEVTHRPDEKKLRASFSSNETK